MTAAWLDVPYRVRFDEAGADGRVHASVLLAWAQDAAWVHSTSLGFGREWYADHGLTWLVRAAELRLVDPPRYGDDVAVRTEIVGFRRVLARRLTTCRDSEGRELSSSITDWALLDARGRPVRIPAPFSDLVDVPTFDPLPVDAPATGRAATSVGVRVRARDVDPLGHANNAAYVNYVEEALAEAGFDVVERLPRTFRLVYLRPAAPGSELAATVVASAESLLAVTLSDPDGRDLMRASLDLGGRRGG
jgi:acyl-CoA thioester hydrolase